MKFLPLVLISLGFLSFQASAKEKASIQQMKGRKAIVLFDEDIPFSVGQKIFIASAEGAELGLSRESRNLLERQNSISLSGSFSSIKPKTGDTATAFGVTGTYSWNWAEYEFGPTLTFSSSDNGTTETTNTSFGGYADYNIDQNVASQEMVWGLVGRVLVGSGTSKTSSGTTNSSTTTIDGGLQAKFFMLSQVLAMRTELVYEFTKTKTSDSSGFVLNLGLQHYF